jgi:hypothetical protein
MVSLRDRLGNPDRLEAETNRRESGCLDFARLTLSGAFRF